MKGDSLWDGREVFFVIWIGEVQLEDRLPLREKGLVKAMTGC